MRRVLVVDDIPAICGIVKMALEADGSCRVMTAVTAFDAIAALGIRRPDGAIIDVAMPAVDGLILARHALGLGVPVLMMTGEPTAQESFVASGIPFMAKPFHIHDVVAQTQLLLREATERHAQLTLQIARLTKNLTEMRGVLDRSRALHQRSQELRRRLKRS